MHSIAAMLGGHKCDQHAWAAIRPLQRAASRRLAPARVSVHPLALDTCPPPPTSGVLKDCAMRAQRKPCSQATYQVG